MGSLTIFVGPMFAGKSTQLLREREKYQFSKKLFKLLTISHIFDGGRIGREQKIIRTHSDLFCEATHMVSKLLPILEDTEYIESDVIFIDEGQFFDDIYEFCEEVMKTKNVYVAFLSGTFERKPFGKSYLLYSIATSIVHVKAICSYCDTPSEAPYTIKIGGNIDKIVEVGAGDKYVPVCLKHYLEFENLKI